MYYFSEHCPEAQWILTNSIWSAIKSMLGLSLGPNAKPFCDEVPNHSLLEHVYKQADEVLKVPCGMSSPPPVEEAGQLKLGSHCLLLIVRINNRYSEHKLFIRPDLGPHKSTEVTKTIFY